MVKRQALALEHLVGTPVSVEVRAEGEQVVHGVVTSPLLHAVLQTLLERPGWPFCHASFSWKPQTLQQRFGLRGCNCRCRPPSHPQPHGADAQPAAMA